MDSQVTPSNLKAKLDQNRNLILVVGGLIAFVLLVVSYYLVKFKSANANDERTTKQTIKVSALSDDISDSSIALQRLEKKIDEYEKKVNQQELVNQEPEFQGSNQMIIDLEEKIRALEEKIQNIDSNEQEMGSHSKANSWHEDKKTLEPTVFPSMDGYNAHDNGYQMISDQYQANPMPVGINIENFKSSATKSKKATNYIPAGTYVKALLIQGIDASASISSQSDPRPVLMRLVSNGSLPNEVSTHIEDCRIIGAAYGDISSERAFVRLESMSCTLKSKDILENIVDGYVVGEDGKAGIRGVVVRREKELLANSFLSGLASGFGSGLSESFQRDLVSPLGVVTETRSSDVFKKGAAEGVSNSFDRLSKYYIERAEQFQPVIQISAGREVDVVFKKGFHLQEGSQPIQLAQDEWRRS